MPHTELKHRIGENMRNARRMARLSQAHVAEKMRLSRTMIWMWENGKTMPTALQVVQLAELYGTPTDTLLQGIVMVPVALLDTMPAGVFPPLDEVRENYKTYMRLMRTRGHDSGAVPLGD